MTLPVRCARPIGLVLLAMFSGLLLWTCGTPRSTRLPHTPRARTPVELPRTVKVLLGSLEGVPQLVAKSKSENRRFQRQDNLVLCDPGFARPVQFWTPTASFEVDGRHYQGQLEVVCRPEGGLRVYVHVDMERYVAGVVAAEIPLWSAEPAELRALAIAVRTYALRTLTEHPAQEPFLWDGVQDQAFRGDFVPGPSDGEKAAATRLANAVEETAGMVLFAGDNLYDVRYHAACGGVTANRQTVFPHAEASPNVPCAPCAARAQAELTAGVPAERRPILWTSEFSAAQMTELARRYNLGPELLLLQPIGQEPTGRWMRVLLQGARRSVELPLDTLRRDLGYDKLKSGFIKDLVPLSGLTLAGGVRFTGIGRGHGVGICQEGLHDYAGRGWSEWDLLAHYLPGCQPKRLASYPRP
ncbi:MAG: SpoIID/LytB domain-containing protein [Planctomycetota bacterium]